MVDGQLLVEEEYRREEDEDRPTNFSLLLGYTPITGEEDSVKMADSNVFSSSLSVERMVGLTS